MGIARSESSSLRVEYNNPLSDYRASVDALVYDVDRDALRSILQPRPQVRVGSTVPGEERDVEVDGGDGRERAEDVAVAIADNEIQAGVAEMRAAIVGGWKDLVAGGVEYRREAFGVGREEKNPHGFTVREKSLSPFAVIPTGRKPALVKVFRDPTLSG